MSEQGGCGPREIGELGRGPGGFPPGDRRPVGALAAGNGDGLAVEASRGVPGGPARGWAVRRHLRSYGMDLLRWFRFLWAVGVAWDRASRAEARDFCRWLRWLACRPGHTGAAGTRRLERPPGRRPARLSASVRAHSETVLRGFYDFHRDAGSGRCQPVPAGPVPAGRPGHAHHNPMEPHRNERAGLYRPTVASRIPRAFPTTEFNEIFARLPSHRDRALVAFYVSTGARASELLSVTSGGVDPGRQLIRVIRKGSGQPRSSGVHRRLRVAAALPGGDGRPDPAGTPPAVVVDAAPPVAPADLSRGAPHVRAGQRDGGDRGDAALAAPHRCLPDGRGSGPPLTDVQVVLGTRS